MRDDNIAEPSDGSSERLFDSNVFLSSASNELRVALPIVSDSYAVASAVFRACSAGAARWEAAHSRQTLSFQFSNPAHGQLTVSARCMPAVFNVAGSALSFTLEVPQSILPETISVLSRLAEPCRRTVTGAI